jgi:hypothetical protein
MERVAHFQFLFLYVSRVLHKSSDKRNFTLHLKALGKECPCMFPKWDPYGNSRPFPEPYLSYPSVSPVEEPSLWVPLIELPQREMLHYQSPPSASQSTW